MSIKLEIEPDAPLQLQAIRWVDDGGSPPVTPSGERVIRYNGQNSFTGHLLGSSYTEELESSQSQCKKVLTLHCSRFMEASWVTLLCIEAIMAFWDRPMVWKEEIIKIGPIPYYFNWKGFKGWKSANPRNHYRFESGIPYHFQLKD